MADVDLSELDELQSRIGKKRACGVGRALAELKGTDLNLLNTALAEYSPGVVSVFLGRRGFTVNANQAASHIRGSCVCVKP